MRTPSHMVALRLTMPPDQVSCAAGPIRAAPPPPPACLRSRYAVSRPIPAIEASVVQDVGLGSAK